MKIRFCENNEGSGVIFKRLRVDSPASDIKREKCLKNCGVCNSSQFVVVDGIPLRGRTGEELYRKVMELLKTG